jgi:hypothetical protein
VLCGVADERELEYAARDLRRLHIPYAEFRDPDLGESMTALCTVPVEDRRPFRRFQLLDPSPKEKFPCQQ